MISESTAKTHVNSIYRKPGVRNRAEVAVAAIRSGLVRWNGAGGDGTRNQAAYNRVDASTGTPS